MKNQEIKFNNLIGNYSILIGSNLLSILPRKIKAICPKTQKIAVIVDKNVPIKFKKTLSNKLKKYNLYFFDFVATEKTKSFKTVGFYIEKLLKKNFNRSDLIIALGGGVTGDTIGFVASVYKRGINFINIPTTFLAQVDSAVGGKTGVNSSYGKNLIGSFYAPKLVICDPIFLKSLPSKEMVSGYAEVLKHAIIKDKFFFKWLKQNTKAILSKDIKKLIYSIKKSCEIKISFVDKDVNEKGLRMKLNFGHTFAHAIEAKNNFSKRTTHGEAVLCGIILATRLSVIKKLCNVKLLYDLERFYKINNLSYTYKKYLNKNSILNLIPFLKNDKKNNDKRINFILIKDIGKITSPDKFKISVKSLKKISKFIVQ